MDQHHMLRMAGEERRSQVERVHEREVHLTTTFAVILG